jgi:ribose/xylose/arabinose/galactoside ABC-type transport system permease subunit
MGHMSASNDISGKVAVSPNKRNSVWSFVNKNRRPASALAFFVVLMIVFVFANPRVFLNPAIYNAVFVSLPISILLVVPMVFIVTSGEIDLSFPSVVGMCAWAFAAAIRAEWSPAIGVVAALFIGILAGLINGFLVTRLKLSSLVATLGMNFLLRGLIHIGNQGYGITVSQLVDTTFYQTMVGKIGGLPIQMIWGLLFALVGGLLFSRHRFGAQVRAVGDNRDSSREMGINVARVKTMAYVYLGVAAALAGVFSTLINTTFYPTTGDGYLLSTLAAVFVGGTPTWGGVGTVAGAVIGAFIVGFIETGIIASGLTGFYTQFFYGLIIILSLISHRFNQSRYRY